MCLYLLLIKRITMGINLIGTVVSLFSYPILFSLIDLLIVKHFVTVFKSSTKLRTIFCHYNTQFRYINKTSFKVHIERQKCLITRGLQENT